MAWSYKAHRDLHAALAVTSVGAILEMAGGADRTYFVIKAAAVCFSISIPINWYGFLIMNEEMLTEDAVRVFSKSRMARRLILAGAASTLLGLLNLVYFFSRIGTFLIVVVVGYFMSYEIRMRLPAYMASQIWKMNITPEARLKEWHSLPAKDRRSSTALSTN